MDLHLTILGSGTSTGVPVIGCRCAVCRSGDARNQRSRCSALLGWDGHQVLIDSGPDLRQQALRSALTAVDAVLYTHAHADHIHGIDDLRMFNALSGRPIPIYGSAAVLQRLRRSFPYIFGDEVRAGFSPQLLPQPVEGPFHLFGRLVVPLVLPHGQGEVLGYRIGPLAYLTDCSAVPEAALACLRGLELLVIGGLRFRPHASHLTVSQALAVIERLRPRQALLTHLSHDVDATRHAGLLPAGVAFAYDGLQLRLPAGDEPSSDAPGTAPARPYR